MIENYILIIGSMKSGTTTLFDLLARHPQIASCTPKEPGFFAFEDRWAEGFDWYEGLFDFEPGRHRYGLDGSTDYSKHPFCAGVPDRLAQSAPRRFKLIYILRHPLRRIESHARHVQRARKEVGQMTSPRTDHGLDAGVSPVSLAASRYAAQIDQYAEYHQAGDLLLLTFEELVAEQAAVLDRVFAFLDLDPVRMAPAHSNAADAHRRRPAFWAALNRLGPVSRAAKTIIPQSLRHGLRDRLSRKIEVTGRFKLTPGEEAEILGDLAPDLDRLRTVYGYDTERFWNIPCGRA